MPKKKHDKPEPKDAIDYVQATTLAGDIRDEVLKYLQVAWGLEAHEGSAAERRGGKRHRCR